MLTEHSTLRLNDSLAVIDEAVCLEAEPLVCITSPVDISLQCSDPQIVTPEDIQISMRQEKCSSGEVLVLDASYTKNAAGRPLLIRWNVVDPSANPVASAFFVQHLNHKIINFPLLEGGHPLLVEVAFSNWIQEELKIGSASVMLNLTRARSPH